MHPVLFKIVDFPISVYGVMVACGMMLAIFFTLRRTRVLGVPDEKLIDLALIGIISGMLGAKLLYVATNFAEFRADPLGNLRSGLVFYGGFLGSLPAGIWYIQKQKLPFWPMLDAIAPAIPLAHAVGRVGCLFAGCCYGAVCDPHFPLGIRYPRHVEMHSMIFYEPAQLAGLPPDAAYSLPVYPTQLLEAAGNLLIMGLLIWLWQRTYLADWGSAGASPSQSRQERGGSAGASPSPSRSAKVDEASLPRPASQKNQVSNTSTRSHRRVLCVYLIAYGVLRFHIEFLRGDAERGLYFNNLVSTSQLIALGLILTGVLLWTRLLDPGKFLLLGTALPGSQPRSSQAEPRLRDPIPVAKKGKRRSA